MKTQSLFLKQLSREIPRIQWSEKSINILRSIFNSGRKIDKTRFGISTEIAYSTQNKGDSSLVKGSDFGYMPTSIQQYIENANTRYYAMYQFDTGTRQVTVHLYQPEPTMSLEKWKKEVGPCLDAIEMWIHLASIYACKECSQSLNIYIYWTSFIKELPTESNQVIDTIHANTAYTTSCRPKTEIYIFRKEEWYKVLIHETFHCFGFDFSSGSQNEVDREIKRLFPIRELVDPRVYESYCEMWAEIMVHWMQPLLDANHEIDFEQAFDYLTRELEKERAYSLYQMTKILDRMGLDYADLFSHDETAIQLRNTRYREKTSVFSYYILKSILMFYVDDFIGWTGEPFQFRKGREKEYVVSLIGERYKRDEYVSSTRKIHDMIYCIANTKTKTKTKSKKCVAIPKKYKHTLRMTAS